ncbi:MAG: hypothetical protein H7A51_11195 [Akkermansiaceae bacterium]|nr:hypothetical protein [Akkermansiaceae bacterium]
MNQRTIILAVLFVVLLPLALLLGQWSATDHEMAMSVAAGIVILVVIAVMQRSIWLLIPLFYAFRFPLSLLPGGFALKDVITMGVAVVMVMIWMVKRYEIRLRFSWIEGMILIQYACLAQAFMRNPVGLSILGGDTVGGRPYFEIAVTAIVFLVLGTQVVDLKKVRLAAKFYLFGGIGSAALEVVASVFPSIGVYIARIYQLNSIGGIMSSLAVEGGYGQVNEYSVGRKEYLSYIVKPLFAWLLAITRPLGLVNIRRPLIVLGFVIVMLAALLSGFRSLLIWIGMMYIAAAIIRRHKEDIVVAVLGGIIMLCVLVGGNGQIFDLPLPVQRTLSFLPGNWDALAEGDANSSAQWRYDMWREVMTSDKYIENKFIGDGFGFSMDDLKFQGQLYMEGGLTPEMMQEHFMRAGQYHSGPIQTINRVGYVGLFLLTIGMIIFVRYALRVIRRAEGTPYYIYAMFVGLPMVVYPFFFYLVIGGYQEAMAMMTISGGMLRLIENSMDRFGDGTVSAG